MPKSRTSTAKIIYLSGWQAPRTMSPHGCRFCIMQTRIFNHTLSKVNKYLSWVMPRLRPIPLNRARLVLMCQSLPTPCNWWAKRKKPNHKTKHRGNHYQQDQRGGGHQPPPFIHQRPFGRCVFSNHQGQVIKAQHIPKRFVVAMVEMYCRPYRPHGRGTEIHLCNHVFDMADRNTNGGADCHSRHIGVKQKPVYTILGKYQGILFDGVRD